MEKKHVIACPECEGKGTTKFLSVTLMCSLCKGSGSVMVGGPSPIWVVLFLAVLSVLFLLGTEPGAELIQAILH